MSTTLGPRMATSASDLSMIAAAAAVTVGLSIAVAFRGPTVLVIPLLIGAFVAIARRPVWAAYVFLAVLPIFGGIERGVIVPLARPNEALQLFLTVAVLAGGCVRAARGEKLCVTITRLDRAIILLAALGSVWPLFWVLARAHAPTTTDVLSTVVLWRLSALYVMFRWVVRSPEHVRRCLVILLASSSLLAMVAVVDSLGIVKIGGLWTQTISQDTAGRGGATLASAIAVGDYLAYTLVIALGWYVQRRAPRLLLAGIGAVLILGSLGTGQFSAWIAAVIVVVIVARRERELVSLAVRFAPIVVLAAVVAWPVVGTRLAGFGDGAGVPSSWLGRIDNLTHFYLPRLAGFHWVLGVRPDSVLPAPETWRQIIFLESGYLWFFWVGGLPLFLGFLYFARVAFRHTDRIWRSRRDDVGLAALAAQAALCSILVLSLIDMHLTLRGGGDLFFILLGLSANRQVALLPPGAGNPEPSRNNSVPANARLSSLR